MKKNRTYGLMDDIGLLKMIKIMRFTIFILFVSLTQTFAINSYSQQTKLNLDMRDVRVEEVIDIIEKNSEFFFMYNKNMINVDRKVDIKVADKSVSEVLDNVFSETDVIYSIKDRQILLINSQMIGIGNKIIIQQNNTVSGRVTDSSNLPLPGVTVVIKGTTQGTITDTDGNYTFPDVSGNKVLVFSFVGMKKQEIEVLDQSVINVIMIEETIGLEEVVAIGYGTVKKSDLTGSVSKITSEQLDKMQMTSIEQGLQGTSSGVHVVRSSGKPGGDITVQIRGNNSIMGGNNPLFVVDGLPMASGINDLATADIASIEILKDASATAIYGARGSNGVVLVTTKKGKAGADKINFSASYGIQQITTDKIEVLNSEQFAAIANEAAENDGMSKEFDLNNMPNINTDWQSLVYRPASRSEYSLSFSGGDDKTIYTVLGNILDQEGIIEKTYYQRQSLRFDLNKKIAKWLVINNNYSFQHIKEREHEGGSVDNRGSFTGSVIATALLTAPTVSPYNSEGDYNRVDTYNFSMPAENPSAYINEIKHINERYRFYGNSFLQLNIMEGLQLKIKGGIDYNSGSSDQFHSKKLPTASSNYGYIGFSKSLNLLNENIVSYNKEFGDNRISAVAGFTMEQRTSKWLSASGSGFPNENIENNDLSSAETPGIPQSGGNKWSLMSWLGRVNYTYKDKYLLTLTGRADGSSRFGAGNKWGYFPSFALGWKLSEEEFIQELNLFSSLKMRASWGKSGNQAVASYQSLASYYSTQSVLGGPSTLAIGYAPSKIPNPNLKWETTATSNIGFDFGFMDNRITFTADYYKKRTYDLLAPVTLPPSTSFSSVIKNIGELENKGFEFSTNIIMLSNSDLTWRLNGNISLNRNKVTKTVNHSIVYGPDLELFEPVNVVMEGQPISAFYGYIEKDLLTEGGLPDYEDLNNDGNINIEDKKIIGNPHPDFTYGLSSNFEYKNFTVDIFFQGVQGNDIFNQSKMRINDCFNKGHNMTVDVLDHWSASNPDRSAAYPKMSVDTWWKISDRFVEDGSYLRLKYLMIAYDFSKLNIDLLKNFDNFKLFVRGENLFTLTKYSWYDPEVNIFGGNSLATGIDMHTYPQSKTFTIGLNITL